jgi:hypothetical protein
LEPKLEGAGGGPGRRVSSSNSSACVWLCLFNRSNYHWSLKLCLPLQGRPLLMQFAQRHPYKLHIVYSDARLQRLVFSLNYSVGSYTDDQQRVFQSLVSVIDGNFLRLTPTSRFLPPPPLSHITIDLGQPVIDLCFSENLLGVFFISQTNGIVLDLVDFKFPHLTTRRNVNLEIEGDYIRFPLLKRTRSNEVEVTFISARKCKDFLTKIVFDEASSRLISNTSEEQESLSFGWLTTTPEGTQTVYLNSENNAIGWSERDLKLEKIRVKQIEDYLDNEGRLHSFILSDNDQLYYNRELLTDNCTSFIATAEFVLFVTMTQGMYDFLHIYRLTEIAKCRASLARLPKLTDGKDHHLRNVERGSELISVSSQRVVFQLPRGNLEIIYPKLLLFHEIKLLINQRRDYANAFNEIKRHKLDMNLIIDINPKVLTEEINNGNFAKSFRKSDHINLILNSLVKEVSTDLAYIYKNEEINEHTNYLEQQSRPFGANKINYICELLRRELSKEQDHFILSIIMTYTRTQPPQLERALELVQLLQNEEDELLDVVMAPHLNPQTMRQDRIKKNKMSSKEVLEYLSWVSDPDYLYQVALATFDLKLAVMVAETTQKDPKEYLPYIESLKGIGNEIDRKVKICLDTQCYSKAITILSEGTEEQIQKSFAIIKEKKLFVQALKVFAKNQTAALIVKEMMADDLVAQKDYKQAGPLYLVANNLDQALMCYQVCFGSSIENAGLRGRFGDLFGEKNIGGRSRFLPRENEGGVLESRELHGGCQNSQEEVQFFETRVPDPFCGEGR